MASIRAVTAKPPKMFTDASATAISPSHFELGLSPAAAAIVALLRSGVGRTRGAPAEMPLQPGQIDWVRAAGNYVELYKWTLRN